MGNNPIWHNDVLGDTLKIEGSKEFVKQYQRYIGMLKSSVNPYIRKFINAIEKDKHIITIKENKDVIAGMTQPMSFIKQSREILNLPDRMDLPDNATDEDYEKAFKLAENELNEIKSKYPPLLREPGVGDDSVVYVPFFNNYKNRTKDEKDFYNEKNINDVKTNNNPHKLLMHELYHAYRIALGLVTSQANGENNRAIEEKLAIRFINVLYQNNQNRKFVYDNFGIKVNISNTTVEKVFKAINLKINEKNNYNTYNFNKCIISI